MPCTNMKGAPTGIESETHSAPPPRLCESLNHCCAASNWSALRLSVASIPQLAAPDGPIPDGLIPDGLIPIPDGPIPDGLIPDGLIPIPDRPIPDDLISDDLIPNGRPKIAMQILHGGRYSYHPFAVGPSSKKASCHIRPAVG